MALLDDARSTGEWTRECAHHLDECRSCQLAVERLRRMTEVWTADRVDDAAIARAEARFHARGHLPRTTSWLDIVPFATAGIAAGCALLVATGAFRPWTSGEATRAHAHPTSEAAVASGHVNGPGKGTQARVAPVFASNDEMAKRVRARSHVATRRGVASLVDGMRLEVSRGETIRVTLDDGHASAIEGPCLVEFWSMPTEVGGWKIIREESTSASGVPTEGPAAPSTTPAIPPSGVSERAPEGTPAQPSIDPSGAASSGGTEPREPNKKGGATGAKGAAQALKEAVASNANEGNPGANSVSARAWARAAVALREDNFEDADRAFDELCHSTEPSTRDAARLARAQLWISRGREAAVRPILEQLAASGATPLIRQRAAETLSR